MKPSELRLLIAFLATLFLVILLVGGSFYVRERRALQAQYDDLDLEWVEVETLLEQRNQWALRSEWLDRHQLDFPGRQPADEAIFELTKAVANPGVRTFDHQFLPGFEGPHYAQAGVRFKAEGAMPNLMQWLYTLQRPEAFRAIRSLAIVPSPDAPGKIRCEIELLQWYAPRESL